MKLTWTTVSHATSCLEMLWACKAKHDSQVSLPSFPFQRNPRNKLIIWDQKQSSPHFARPNIWTQVMQDLISQSTPRKRSQTTRKANSDLIASPKASNINGVWSFPKVYQSSDSVSKNKAAVVFTETRMTFQMLSVAPQVSWRHNLAPLMGILRMQLLGHCHLPVFNKSTRIFPTSVCFCPLLDSAFLLLIKGWDLNPWLGLSAAKAMDLSSRSWKLNAHGGCVFAPFFVPLKAQAVQQPRSLWGWRNVAKILNERIWISWHLMARLPVASGQQRMQKASDLTESSLIFASTGLKPDSS